MGLVRHEGGCQAAALVQEWSGGLTGAAGMQVLELEVAFANGTLAIVNGQSHSHLFRALQVRPPSNLALPTRLSAHANDRQRNAGCHTRLAPECRKMM